MKKDDFGDRMKKIERRETGRDFLPYIPVYARIDGRGFSKFTRGMERPYSIRMSDVMIETTKYLIEHTHARCGFTQSDEINLTWLQEEPKSEIFFDGKIQKMVSVLAGMASSRFLQICSQDSYFDPFVKKHLPHFDCRVFQLPNLAEGANVFLWREQDATKNSVSMAAQAFYSHKELQGKSGPEMQEMMFQKGQNFNDYPASFKRGTFVRRSVQIKTFTDDEWLKIP
jgi:tRNA(His) guanylyltransferase